VSTPEKKIACQWMSKNKFLEICDCGELPTKLAVRCGKWYCPFHFKLAKNFKPFDK